MVYYRLRSPVKSSRIKVEDFSKIVAAKKALPLNFQLEDDKFSREKV